MSSVANYSLRCERQGFQESLLQRMQFVVFLQTLDRGDLLAANSPDRRHARTHYLPIDEYCARAAARFSATVFRSGQVEVISQNVEQRRLRIDINAQLLSVHVQTRYVCHSDFL